MKQIFTPICIFICCLIFSKASNSQCNYTVGGNGVATALPIPVIIDGNMADWGPVLNDPDNNNYDFTGGSDMDAPIGDNGRDLTRFAFTEDANNLYLYFERAGSTNNTVDMIYYADINDNGIMEYREPVIHMSWSGATGNVSAHILDYNPSLLGILFNSITSNLDGSALLGTLQHRNYIGSSVAKGSADGKSVEVKIPFTQLTQLNLLGEIVNQLYYGQDFKFHLSTINGHISSIPGSNSINDNFGGCVKAGSTIILPVKLLSFRGLLNNNKAELNWAVAANETGQLFEVQKSNDGKNFSVAAVVMTTTETGNENYNYRESISATSFFRLKLVNNDGSSSYSHIVKLGNDKAVTAKSLTVLQNPVAASLQFNFTTTTKSIAIANIYSMNGAKVMSQNISVEAGQNSLSLDVHSKLTQGTYLLEVVSNNERSTAKIFKQ